MTVLQSTAFDLGSLCGVRTAQAPCVPIILRFDKLNPVSPRFIQSGELIPPVQPRNSERRTIEMKAIGYNTTGAAEVLEALEIDRPRRDRAIFWLR